MTRPAGPGPVWVLLGLLVLSEIGYPLAGGGARAALVVATVLLGYLASVGHALLTRGPAVAGALVAVTTAGGLAVEIVGVATGVPFGGYAYTAALGPGLAGVPLVIPLAWTWMAWPAWLAAARLVRPAPARVALAAVGLAAWDLFLDPQMVAEGYWRWRHPAPALPGVAAVPVTNYLGWLLVAAVMAALLAAVPGVGGPPRRADLPMLAGYLWTYGSSALAHVAFLDLAAAAGWGALGMGLVAVPLAAHLWRAGPDGTAG